MLRIFNKIFFLPSYFVKRLNLVAKGHKSHEKLYAYYSFPVFMSLLISSVVIRSFNTIFPNLRIVVNGIHIHHFTFGILILLISGYVGLFIKSEKSKYILALAYGTGVAFLLDEFYVWLKLDSSVLSHSQYSGIVIALSLFLTILLFTSGIGGLVKLFMSNNDIKFFLK